MSGARRSSTETGQRIGWNTSIGAGGKAHFYEVTGKPACGDRLGIWPDGVTRAELFTRPTRPATVDDHYCRDCAKKHPHVCTCWSCQAKRRGAKRP